MTLIERIKEALEIENEVRSNYELRQIEKECYNEMYELLKEKKGKFREMENAKRLIELNKNCELISSVVENHTKMMYGES